MLLFLIAIVQILYACASLLLCAWKLRRWRHYERVAAEQHLRPLHSRFLPRPGDNPVTHALRCAVSMLTGALPWGQPFVQALHLPQRAPKPDNKPPAADSVNSEVYLALRRLFVERLDVDPGFDFHGRVCCMWGCQSAQGRARAGPNGWGRGDARLSCKSLPGAHVVDLPPLPASLLTPHVPATCTLPTAPTLCSSFLSESMEEEFAAIVGVSPLLWLIVLVRAGSGSQHWRGATGRRGQLCVRVHTSPRNLPSPPLASPSLPAVGDASSRDLVHGVADRAGCGRSPGGRHQAAGDCLPAHLHACRLPGCLLIAAAAACRTRL